MRAYFATAIPVAAIFAVLVSGCTPEPKSAVGPAKPPTTSAPSASTEGGPIPKGVGTVDPSGKITEPHIPPSAFAVPKPGQGGYTPAPTPLSELGKKMDNAVATTQMTLGEATTVMEVGGAKLVGNTKIKIQDDKTYSVEYYTPATKAELNKVIADGKSRVLFYNGNWSGKPAPGGLTNDLPKVAVESWPADFTRTMFAGYESGSRVWQPLLAYLERGEGGFKATLEQKTEKVLGNDRLIYQIIARREQDNTEIQVRVDGTKFLPLTIRTNRRYADGKSDSIMWTVDWKIGGKFESTEFRIPVKPAGP